MQKLSVISLLMLLSTAAWAGQSGSGAQAPPTAGHAGVKSQPGSGAQSHGGHVDPFTGKSLSYENLRNTYQSASIQAKIARAKYQTARYEHQIAQMKGKTGGQGGGNTKHTAKQKKMLQQLKTQVSQLAGQIKMLKHQRHHAQLQATKAHHKKQPVKLLAIYKTGQGHNEAMVKYKGHINSLGQGAKLGHWHVASINANEAVLSSHHKKHVLHLADSAGHMSSVGRRAYSRSGKLGMGGSGSHDQQQSGQPPQNSINNRLQREAQALSKH